ncbi:MAG: FkbM family methyltransferase [Gemmatimonas sp.]
MRKSQIVLRLMLRHFPAVTRKWLTNQIDVTVGDREVTIPVADDAGLRIVYWEDTWKTDVIRRLNPQRRGKFVDIGANVGETLLDLRSNDPDSPYVGFEPSASCVNYLRDLARVNGFRETSIVPVGLADRPTIHQLHTAPGVRYDGTATIIGDLRPDREFETAHVPCFAFDDIRASVGIDDISFMKIDVEGAELEVLSGMSTTLRTLKPTILCEVLFTDSKGSLEDAERRNSALMDMLKAADYEVWQLIKNSENTRVVDLRRVTGFESDYYSERTQDLCDYIFVPSVHSQAVRSTLLH